MNSSTTIKQENPNANPTNDEIEFIAFQTEDEQFCYVKYKHTSEMKWIPCSIVTNNRVLSNFSFAKQKNRDQVILKTKEPVPAMEKTVESVDFIRNKVVFVYKHLSLQVTEDFTARNTEEIANLMMEEHKHLVKQELEAGTMKYSDLKLLSAKISFSSLKEEDVPESVLMFLDTNSIAVQAEPIAVAVDGTSSSIQSLLTSIQSSMLLASDWVQSCQNTIAEYEAAAASWMESLVPDHSTAAFESKIVTQIKQFMAFLEHGMSHLDELCSFIKSKEHQGEQRRKVFTRQVIDVWLAQYATESKLKVKHLLDIKLHTESTPGLKTVHTEALQKQVLLKIQDRKKVLQQQLDDLRKLEKFAHSLSHTPSTSLARSEKKFHKLYKGFDIENLYLVPSEITMQRIILEQLIFPALGPLTGVFRIGEKLSMQNEYSKVDKHFISTVDQHPDFFIYGQQNEILPFIVAEFAREDQSSLWKHKDFCKLMWELKSMLKKLMKITNDMSLSVFGICHCKHTIWIAEMKVQIVDLNALFKHYSVKFSRPFNITNKDDYRQAYLFIERVGEYARTKFQPAVSKALSQKATVLPPLKIVDTPPKSKLSIPPASLPTLPKTSLTLSSSEGDEDEDEGEDLTSDGDDEPSFTPYLTSYDEEDDGAPATSKQNTTTTSQVTTAQRNSTDKKTSTSTKSSGSSQRSVPPTESLRRPFQEVDKDIVEYFAEYGYATTENSTIQFKNESTLLKMFTNQAQESVFIKCTTSTIEANMELKHKALPEILGSWEVMNKPVARKLINKKTARVFVIVMKTYTPLLSIVSAMPNKKLIQVAKDLVEVMKFLHSAGIGHQDIHIENVMYDSKQYQVKLIDFGRAVLNPNTKCKAKDYLSLAMALGRFARMREFGAPVNAPTFEDFDESNLPNKYSFLYPLTVVIRELITSKDF